MIAHTLEAHPFLLSSFCKQPCWRAQEDLGIGGGEASKDLEDAQEALACIRMQCTLRPVPGGPLPRISSVV